MLKNNLNNRGLSLIEIMVALLILMVAFISLIQSFPFSQTIVKTAENSTKASYLAQNELERLLALNYDNIPAGTIETKQRLAADPTNYLYYFQRQTIVNYLDSNWQASASDTGLKKISVTVYYTNSTAKKENSYSLSALASQR
ncbi:MAG: prepilin-type N-terminal cleavage/methylation domain-containing protein [Parcubacteria group bacterium]|nr:prepilin-type N-terminal cleavage/methylation domain-containing protein [Parcubacteria group bacterium]